MRRIVVVPLLIFIFYSSCSKEATSDAYTNENESLFGISASPSPFSGEALFYKDVSYGSGPRNKLDVFLPKANRLKGMLVLFHGGSFQFGSKEGFYSSEFSSLFSDVLSNQIGIVNASYSFITDPNTKGVFTSLEDGSKVIEFITKNSETLNLPSNKIVLAGVSAGAGIAMWNGFRENSNTQVEGIVALYAQSSYDLYDWESLFSELNLDALRAQNTEIQDLFSQFYAGQYTLEKGSDLKFVTQMDLNDPAFYVYNPVYEDQIFSEDTLNLDVLFHSYKHADFLRKNALEVGLEFSGIYQELPQVFVNRILTNQ